MRRAAWLVLVLSACEAAQAPPGSIVVEDAAGAADGSPDGSRGTAEDAAAAEDVAGSPPYQGALFVVTTRQIAAESQALGPFLDHKRALGFDAILVTEDHYGADGAKGQERAIAIRQWLAAAVPAHEGPAYALLVGNAHALYGDLPMFTVWPRHSYQADSCLGTTQDCRAFESDMPYANLTGDWDLNGDGLWGQHELDDGPGGIDFHAELLVGRIPVYFGEIGPMDEILSHAMAYETEPAADREWRDRVLLPAAFFFFRGETLGTYTLPYTIDAAATPEWFIANVLPKHPGVSVTRMYERDGYLESAYPSELPLSEPGVVTEWSQGYGIVWWFGHGLQRGVYRKVWAADADGDQIADEGEVETPYLLTSEAAAGLQAGHPAFVVGVSCEVGSLETPQNLAFAVLLSGGAVGMVASSELTVVDTTHYGDPGSQLDTQACGATNVGVSFVDALLGGEVGSKALYDAKLALGLSGSIEAYAGRMMLNYVGDPTLRLRGAAPSQRADRSP